MVFSINTMQLAPQQVTCGKYSAYKCVKKKIKARICTEKQEFQLTWDFQNYKGWKDFVLEDHT